MHITLIRHGRTPGNEAGQYIGCTDEPLSPDGAARLRRRAAAGLYPAADALVISPMRRCRETAAILYPGLTPLLEPGLRECDFGAFERRTHAQLKQDEAYLFWQKTAGRGPVPGVEGRDAFCARCCEAFTRTANTLVLAGAEHAAFIVHGGTIMAVLEGLGLPKRDFYDWQAQNGCGFAAVWERSGQHLTAIEPLPGTWDYLPPPEDST